jgi:hypothetical protein
VPNQLGADVRSVSGLRFSYVLPPRVAPVREGWISPCTESERAPLEWIFRRELRSALMPALLGSDGRWYPTLDRFPTHLPGNLRAVHGVPVFDGKSERCAYVALTRGGVLQSLGYDATLDAFASVPARTQEKWLLADFDVGPSAAWAVGVATDGTLLKIEFDARAEELSYKLSNIAPTEVKDVYWRRATVFASGKDTLLAAESRKGALFVYAIEKSGALKLVAGTGVLGPVPSVPWHATVGIDGLLHVPGTPVAGAMEALR